MTSGPGPHERRLRNRIIFKLRGRWPQSVVQERMLEFDRQRMRELEHWLDLQRTREGTGR